MRLPSDKVSIEHLVVIKRTSYVLFIGTALTLIVFYFLFTAIAENQAFGWPIARSYIFNGSILRGLRQTLTLTATIMIASIIIGAIIAVMRLSSSKILNIFSSAYIWFFRGTPALLQLIFWFNLSILIRELSLSLPFFGTIFAIKTNDFMTPFFSAVIALSLHEAGYMAEIIRAGIKSVPSGQAEAARSLGMHPFLVLKRIIMPQAMRFIVPPTGNETISLLKMTSLVTFIAVDDLLYAAQSIYARTFETIPLLIVVAFWYLSVVTLLSIVQYFIEIHYGRSEFRAQSTVSMILNRLQIPKLKTAHK